MSYTYDYPRPAVTADAVVFAREQPTLWILLVQRDRPPFEGAWALPGGFVEIDEPLESAALRELREETGVCLDCMQQLGAFGGVERDPRGRVISIAYWAQVDRRDHAPVAADDARAVRWFDIEQLPELAFDHREVVAAARARL